MSEASKQALKRGMTPTHELMMNWILENPGGTLRQMGAFFGYSPSWLSTMMHSDAFKAYAAGRLKDVNAYVTQDIPARMRGLAELAIDRMQDVLMNSEDADVLKDSFDKVMNRYGYAPGTQKQNPLSPTYQQNNVFYVSQEQFQRLQGKIVNAHSNALPTQALPAPEPEKEISADPQEIPSGS
jgi:hypothetical protein